MGELFLSHNAFYAPNGYGAVHIGKKRLRISMMPMEKVHQFTKPRNPLNLSAPTSSPPRYDTQTPW